MAYESRENYLETILMLSSKMSSVRSIDIAHELNFSKPSVSIAMKNLKQQGYINIIDGKIELTDIGKKIALNVYEKHEVLTKLFIKLGVSPIVAEEDACKIEHIISDETFEKIKDSIK